MLRIQVKAKQGREWPGVRGVHGDAIVLVLVDYEKKTLSDRPDFYILRPRDWVTLIGNHAPAARLIRDRAAAELHRWIS